MKTLKSIILVIALVVSSAIAVKADKKGKASKSSVTLDVTIAAHPKNKIVVGFDKLESETVFIKILNSDGDLLHVEEISDMTKVLKRFDMSNLPSGKYSYIVHNDLYKVKKVMEKK